MQSSKKIAINGVLHPPPPGVDVTNFIDPSVPCFRARRRGKMPVTELIIHETVTTSVATTIKVLQRRKLGVHFIIGPDGLVTQHNNLLLDRLAHAPPHNKRSVGVEVVQPYYAEPCVMQS
jgi:N-acetyl-anhydromuramyl-L-alanine amidase AmpD